MAGMIKRAVLIIRGEERMTDDARFRFLAVFTGIVHVILAGIGIGLSCGPLAVSNLIAAVVAGVILIVTKCTRKFFMGISIIYFVTCFQSLFACALLGWTYGFSLYNLVEIPVLFYMLYMTKNISNPKKYALVYTIINCICTLVLRRYVYEGDPLYYYPVNTDFRVSFFNNIVCFLYIIAFSTLFILELTANREELEKQTRELKHLANYDELTKLRNRRSMLNVWKDLKRTDYCVVMGDIDDFKKINDTYGHEKGDEVLKLVAGSMQRAVDGIDYVSRWGGEEFLMIVFGNIAYALKVIDKVQRELKNADLMVGEQKIVVTMTFGISECGGAPCGDIDELIRQADRRLYIGKNSGKNCIKIKDE